ncbi:hypothetical protein C1645_836799 [Glomus cerebriforme]|uniref:Uncharacterized protein n=1 Tax=Glomus cerebriforme TaxID=658196 RepID=A0A397SFM9_9GLOM|nr:hypothetical protein C1645_836799 [Glomus cerebriforme]
MEHYEINFHYQNLFMTSKHLDFYTDSSLINPTKNTTSMGFAVIQSSSAAPYIEFAAHIKRWLSSYRAELAAILVALIISLMNSTIIIFTDNSNNFLWNIIMDIIDTNLLNINFVKIQAHSGNQYNNLIDKLAKDFNNLNTLPLNFNFDHISTIKYAPKWNSIFIETNLRKFITSISRNRGFKYFLSLYRNCKYIQDIDWITTFFSLNDEESITETSFYANDDVLSAYITPSKPLISTGLISQALLFVSDLSSHNVAAQNLESSISYNDNNEILEEEMLDQDQQPNQEYLPEPIIIPQQIEIALKAKYILGRSLPKKVEKIKTTFLKTLKQCLYVTE